MVPAAAVFAVTFVVVRAQQSAAPAPKPLVPAAASSIAANPEHYMGQIVTVFAAVERVLSPTSFTVDQDPARSGTGEVLVVAALLNAPPIANAYVTVIGEVAMVDGRPAIKATTVLDAKMVDLAKKPLPPLTPEEQAFDAVMKRVQPAFAALRQAVAESNGEGTKAQAAILKQAFAETEAFFKKRGKPDAEKWAVEARTHAQALELASAGKWEEAKTALPALQQSCSSCHAVYRERQDDGSYRIR
jgi:cytochrome c556